MANKNAIVYNVNGLSFNSLKTAQSATKNVTAELAKRFDAESRNLSQFAKCLANWNDATANNFKSFVLGLKDSELSNSDSVFSAIRAKYPFKNADGKLVKSKAISKGVYTTEIITLFEASILDAIQYAWLTNKSVTILPNSFTKDAKGNITAIDDKAIEKAISEKADKRENAKVTATARVNLYDELIKRANALNSCKKLADFESAKSAILETLSAIQSL